MMSKFKLSLFLIGAIALTPIISPRVSADNSISVKQTRPSNANRNRITVPQVAARRLYLAWKGGNRPAALVVASPAAVNRLFSRPFTGPDLRFQSCTNRDAGFDCAYSYEGGGLIMRVTGGASAGYRVESLRFIAD